VPSVVQKAAIAASRIAMDITELLVPERVRCREDISSKKRALELLGELISSGSASLAPQNVFNCLLAREKLGSTGLGHGVAIPHGRMADVGNAIGAVLTLEKGVDFDAPDGAAVDLIVGLIVPVESTDEHLHILSRLAEAFSVEEKVSALRRATTPEQVCQLLGEATLRA